MKKNIEVKIKEFKRFLKDENIYSSFINEFKRQKETRRKWILENFYTKPTNSSFNEYAFIVKEYNFIQYAFRWSETFQGHEYWKDKNNKWRRLINGTLSLPF